MLQENTGIQWIMNLILLRKQKKEAEEKAKLFSQFETSIVRIEKVIPAEIEEEESESSDE